MYEPKKINFYDQTYIKSYNLDKAIQYELSMLGNLDVFTRAHSENVAIITCNLCKKLHCTKGFTEYCVTCAYLHDVGKQFIPSSILQKPGKLTPEEYEIIKNHTVLGYKLCRKTEKLRPYAAGAYYHHEALDGTGYPQGLLKKDIPYEAQIIRVADEYDALVNKRQYKTHIGISDSLKIIIDNTKPSPNAAPHTGYTKAGKTNKLIVRKLLKVVIDDIEYEISTTMNYINSLKKDLRRLKKAAKYARKRDSAKKQSKIYYYNEYVKLMLRPNESPEDVYTILAEHESAYQTRMEILKGLFNEIKIIKKLKV